MPNISTEDAKGSRSQSYSVFKEIESLGGGHRKTSELRGTGVLASWRETGCQRGCSINAQHVNKGVIGSRILNGF